MEKPNTNTPDSKVDLADKDSLGVSQKKSPWMLFALLQIPIVIIMIIIIYVMSTQGN